MRNGLHDPGRPVTLLLISRPQPTETLAMGMLLVPLLLFTVALRAGADEPAEKVKDVWAVGTKVLPTKHPDKIQFGDWIDDKQEYFKLSGIMPMEVRKDKGDGWVRILDGHREGWVQKKDLVSEEDAPIFWDKAVKVDPKDRFALLMRGLARLQKAELDSALADFNECIRLDPADASARSGRGITWSAKKEYDKAIADYTEMIRLDPKAAGAHSNRGNAWSEKMEYDKAIADYTEAIRLDPKSMHGHYGRGLAWSNKKEYDKAIADYTEAIRLDPKPIIAYNNRGAVWSHKKEYTKAIADYTKAIWLDPKDADAHYNRGYARHDKKEYDGAIIDYTEVIRLDPEYVNAHSGRATSWNSKGEYNKAITDYAAALKLEPTNSYALFSKAATLAKLKKYGEAVEHFDKALKLDPSASIHQIYAHFRATCPDAKYRDGEKAVQMAKSAIEKAGKDADWEYSATLAAAYAEAGDFELAVTEQRKVLDDKHIHATDKKEQEARLVLYRAKKPYRDE